jgi:hypothetical protein
MKRWRRDGKLAGAAQSVFVSEEVRKFDSRKLPELRTRRSGWNA